MKTLNQIISQVTDFADAHQQIASSGVGTIAELQADPDREYPLLWAQVLPSDTDAAYLTNNIVLIVADRVITGEEGEDNAGMEQEVLSDSLSILIDALSYFVQQHAQEYVVEKVNTLTPFTEDWNDRVAGHSVTLQIKQFHDWNKCQIPETGAAIPPSVDGLTLYDFCDQSVLDRLTAAQVVCLETAYGGACDDATVNANGSLLSTVASGGTLNVDVHDTADNNVGAIVSSTEIEIADNDITFNGSSVDSVNAEETYAFIVNLDGSPSGSYDAGTNTVTVTSAATASLAVSVDDSTPNFGDTVNITATPTGFTPTNYLYFLYDGTSVVGFIADQASGSFAWSAAGPNGSFDIYVVAMDGSGNKVWNSTNITLTGLFLDQWTDATSLWSFSQERYDFTGHVIKVRRSSDNAEMDFGFVDFELDVAGIEAFCGVGDGFLVAWYDQVCENVAYELTASNQPTIVSSGTVVTKDTYSCADYDGSSDRLDFVFPLTVGSAYVVAAADSISASQLNIVLGNSANNDQMYYGGSAATGIGVTGAQTTTEDTNLHRTSLFTQAGANDGVYVDEGADSNVTALGGFTYDRIGNRQGTSAFSMNGKIIQIITFSDDQWANRTAQEAYISNKYS